jgi:hypothetical protein
MKRATKREFNLNQSSLKEKDLNKISTGCAPCLNEAFNIDRQINKRTLSEIKIDEIKRIVRSIFESKKNGN